MLGERAADDCKLFLYEILLCRCKLNKDRRVPPLPHPCPSLKLLSWLKQTKINTLFFLKKKKLRISADFLNVCLQKRSGGPGASVSISVLPYVSMAMATP